MAGLSRSKEGKEYWNELAERWLRCADNLEREEQTRGARASRQTPRKTGRIIGRPRRAA
jgi:hypothetical protein